MLFRSDPDPNMEIVTYERSWEQNEDWGLNDMKVEGYEGDPMLKKDVKENEKVTEPVS